MCCWVVVLVVVVLVVLVVVVVVVVLVVVLVTPGLGQHAIVPGRAGICKRVVCISSASQFDRVAVSELP